MNWKMDSSSCVSMPEPNQYLIIFIINYRVVW